VNNKRLIVAILFLVLAGAAALVGFTKVEVWPASPQVIIYPAGALALLGLVQLWLAWRRTHRAK
jgi:membrane protein YdbS with pleckstrin-like domain